MVVFPENLINIVGVAFSITVMHEQKYKSGLGTEHCGPSVFSIIKENVWLPVLMT